MRTFWTKLKVAFAVARAVPSIHRLLSQGEFQKALDIIESLPEREHMRLPWRVSKIQLRHFLRRDADVVREASPLLFAIDGNRTYNEHERRYFRAYVLELGRASCARLAGCDAVFPVPDYDGVDLDRVPGTWKRDFPLNTHPDW